MGALGHVTGLAYGFDLHGCKACSFTVARPPLWRTDVLDPGRVCEVWRGGSRVWEGILDEPVPGTSGWSVTAHGAGTYGDSFACFYSHDGGEWNLDTPIDRAITQRGLRWRKPVFGTSLGWMQNQASNASITISDFLDNATAQAGLTWNVDSRQGNLLAIAPPPPRTSPDRILVCTVPNPRTLAAGLNRLFYTWVNSDDGSGNQTTDTESVWNAGLIARHGAMEQAVDFTSAGYMTGAQAIANANAILDQYTYAAFTTAFNVQHGQWLTMGGSAVDLGTETAWPHAARVILTDGSYGGEAVAVPYSFTVSEFAYDDDSQTAQVTPYNTYKSDLQTLLTTVVPALRQ